MIEDIRVQLGKTEIQISAMGLGAWSWGDKIVWSYGRSHGDQDIREAFFSSLEAGINFYDTAEAYGSGRSERLLGGFLSEVDSPQVIASKFMPYPWRLSRSMLDRSLRVSINRLKLEKIDLYQIHWPFPPISIETWAKALGDSVEAGLVRSVGVSNYNESQMRRAYTVLAKRGIPLASNQVEYSILNRKIEFNGLFKACKELGITVIAYSPLNMGVLTGKYSPEHPLPGIRGRRYSRSYLEKAQPLINLMREIGREHDNKSPAQVALNWCICKGSVPIAGAKNGRQAKENAGALGWRLAETEVNQIDQASSGIA